MYAHNIAYGILKHHDVQHKNVISFNISFILFNIFTIKNSNLL